MVYQTGIDFPQMIKKFSNNSKVIFLINSYFRWDSELALRIQIGMTLHQGVSPQNYSFSNSKDLIGGGPIKDI